MFPVAAMNIKRLKYFWQVRSSIGQEAIQVDWSERRDTLAGTAGEKIQACLF